MANLQRMTESRLGEILVHGGLITSQQLDEVLADQKQKDSPIGELLVDRGYVTERDVAEAITTQFGLPYLSPTQYYTSTSAMKLLPLEFMRKHRLVPIDKMGEVLVIVISGPVDSSVLDEIEKMTGSTVQVYVGMARDVTETIDKLAGGES